MAKLRWAVLGSGILLLVCSVVNMVLDASFMAGILVFLALIVTVGLVVPVRAPEAKATRDEDSAFVQSPEPAPAAPPQAEPVTVPAPAAVPVRAPATGQSLPLRWLGGEFAVARLDPARGVPPWASELLETSHQALELRLALSEVPASSAGLACDGTVSKQKRRKEEWSRLVWLGLSPGELTLVAPWWLIRDRQTQIAARRDNPGPKTRKGEVLPPLSCDYTSLQSVQGPWAAFCVDGELDFGQTGILASLAEPLAREGISIFVYSSWNTDFVLLPADKADAAEACLRAAGHRFV